MLTREKNILNLLKRAIFYAADGAVQLKDITFSEKEALFLIANFDIYHAYAETEAKSREESAYQATNRMAFYLHDHLATYDNVIMTNSRIAFLKRWNQFLFVDCITPGFLTGLSEHEMALFKNNTLSREKQYNGVYQFILFNNPSTENIKKKIRDLATDNVKTQHIDPKNSSSH